MMVPIGIDKNNNHNDNSNSNDNNDDEVDHPYRSGSEGSFYNTGSSDHLELGGESNHTSAAAAAQQQAAPQAQLLLAQKETQVVGYLRCAVLILLLSATAAVSTLVFRYTRQDEQHEFITTFERYGNQIIDSVQLHARHKLEAAGALALDIQAYAILIQNQNQNNQNNQNTTTTTAWPNVTVPFFEERVMATQSLTNAYGVLLFPIVTTEARAGWEEYSTQHVDWIWDSYAAQRHVYNGNDQSRLTPEQLQNTSNINWFDHLWGNKYKNPNNPDFSSGISSRIMTTQHDDPNVYDPIIIIDDDDDNDNTGNNHPTTFFPQWQAAPMKWYYQTTVNSNYGYFDDFYQQTVIVNATHSAVWGMAWSDSNTPGYLSTMLYPILNQFYSNNDDNDNGEDEEEFVVAYLGVDIFWKRFLEGILPPNLKYGIYVVIENTCNQTFTFQIYGGDEVVWVGDGDWHEPQYTHMEQSTLFGKYLMKTSSSNHHDDEEEEQEEKESKFHSKYTGKPLYNDFCPYTFKIYPSKEMEDVYTSQKPILYTIGACLIFFFTSLVFIMYDCLVEKRQQIVMSSATTSDAIVSSLFPTPVKEKLYQQQESADLRKNSSTISHHNTNTNTNNNNNNNNYRRQGSSNLSINSGSASFVSAGRLSLGSAAYTIGNTAYTIGNTIGKTIGIPTTSESARDMLNSESSSETKVVRGFDRKLLKQQQQQQQQLRSENDEGSEQIIADVYPETTILFADIAGFTAWSNGREPTDVFILLETMYSMFDKIAQKRGVFKFSTIGDCYLAATGIPSPQSDHAIRMVKFARDCQDCLPNLLHELSKRLGDETTALTMRAGCHSGSVTAGVLRGDKIRFELFGDTVNTASRMESNGQPNRIHVSQSTADLIVAAGKSNWITPRADKIVAKGKGEMQTYWVNVMRSSRGGGGDSGSVTSGKSEVLNARKTQLLVRQSVGDFDKFRSNSVRRSILTLPLHDLNELNELMEEEESSTQNINEDDFITEQ